MARRKAINEIIISSSNIGLTRLTIAGSMTFFFFGPSQDHRVFKMVLADSRCVRSQYSTKCDGGRGERRPGAGRFLLFHLARGDG